MPDFSKVGFGIESVNDDSIARVILLCERTTVQPSSLSSASELFAVTAERRRVASLPNLANVGLRGNAVLGACTLIGLEKVGDTCESEAECSLERKAS